MSNDVLNKKVADSPAPTTYSPGSLIEFKVVSYKVQTVTGGFLVRVSLQPLDIVDWPEDEDTPDISQLPLNSYTFFFMDNRPSALSQFSLDMEKYMGIEHDESNTLRAILEEMRGAAVTFYISDGPNERGDYKMYMRQNND